METGITGLSSMATKRLLAEVSVDLSRSLGVPVTFASGGGVEIAQRVRDGASADLVVLGLPSVQLERPGRAERSRS